MTAITRIVLLVILIVSFSPRDAYSAFTIETDLRSIDFGLMKPDSIRGDVPPQGVTVHCVSDQGNAWFLRIRLDNPLSNVNDPSSTISSKNFWWYGLSTSGAGTLIMDEQDFLLEKIVYTAPPGEGAQGVDVKVRFKINIPRSAQSGQYTTRIIFTLIE